jgi:hypothetical protein
MSALTSTVLAAEIIKYHADQAAEYKASAATALQECVKAAGVVYVATDVVEDGSGLLTDALVALKRGNLHVAEGLIASALDALSQLKAAL